MFFGGILQSARNVLRDNKNLTPSGKNRKIKLGQQSVQSAKIVTPTATKEVLEQIRHKAIKTRNKQLIKLLLVFILSFLVFVLFITPIFNSSVKNAESQSNNQLQIIRENANFWLTKGSYHNAILWYKSGIERYPTKTILWSEFLYCLYMNCLVLEQDCELSNNYLTILDRLPSFLQFQQLTKQFDHLR